MDLISPATVAERIELYLQNRWPKTLTPGQAQAVAPFLRRETRHNFTNEIRDRLAAFEREPLSEPDTEKGDIQDQPRARHCFATTTEKTNN
jgi:hypothetical protein